MNWGHYNHLVTAVYCINVGSQQYNFIGCDLFQTFYWDNAGKNCVAGDAHIYHKTSIKFSLEQ